MGGAAPSQAVLDKNTNGGNPRGTGAAVSSDSLQFLPLLLLEFLRTALSERLQ